MVTRPPRYNQGRTVTLQSPFGHLKLENFTGNFTLLMVAWVLGVGALVMWITMLALGAVAGYFGHNGPSLLVTISLVALVTIFASLVKE